MIPLFPGGGPHRMSEDLAALRHRYEHKPVTLRELIVILRGRAYMLLVILLSLPFVTPIPLPGLSTPLGLAIAFITFRLALGKRPWLPARLRRREIPAGFFSKVIGFTERIIRFLETFLKPRWGAFIETGLLVRLHSTLMCVAALVLLLPLPIPFTNSFPAWTIILVAAGLLERDGAAVAMGYFVALLGVLYGVFLGDVAQHGVGTLWRWLGF